jgi:hypothetical protein
MSLLEVGYYILNLLVEVRRYKTHRMSGLIYQH